jgi:hypothetical protein
MFLPYVTLKSLSSKCELHDDGGKQATETCGSKGGPLMTLGSHK